MTDKYEIKEVDEASNKNEMKNAQSSKPDTKNGIAVRMKHIGVSLAKKRKKNGKEI